MLKRNRAVDGMRVLHYTDTVVKKLVRVFSGIPFLFLDLGVHISVFII